MKQAVIFIAFALTLISCSRKSESELMQEASMAHEQKNYPVAIERYQELVDRFERSAAAETAMFRIAAIYGNDMHDQRKALSMYALFYKTFPNSSDAPTSLFLTGFIYNNELHIMDSARLAYEAFLKQYPGHSLAMSAQFELQTLGKDPGEFLPREVASGERGTTK